MEETGISFLGVLAILFIWLKLTGQIAWSWLWVLAPLWMPFPLVVLVVGLIVLGIAMSNKLNRSK